MSAEAQGRCEPCARYRWCYLDKWCRSTWNGREVRAAADLPVQGEPQA